MRQQVELGIVFTGLICVGGCARVYIYCMYSSTYELRIKNLIHTSLLFLQNIHLYYTQVKMFTVLGVANCGRNEEGRKTG